MFRLSGKLLSPAMALCAIAVVAGPAWAQDEKSNDKPRSSTILFAPDDSPLKADLSGEVTPAPAVAKSPDVAKPADPGKLPGHDAPGHICSTGDLSLDAIVRDAGSRYGVDPCFITAVMGAESGYRRFAISPKGASGYMQLMPDTARRFGVVDLFDARQNVHAGSAYLRWLLDRFNGQMDLALAGYNAGEGAVERYGRRVPPFTETQNYVRVITSRYVTRHAARAALRGGPAGAAPMPAPRPVEGPTAPQVAWRISVDLVQPR